MSRRQFGFLVGFLIAWLWAVASFLVTLAAVVAGLVGYVVARILEGDLALDELAARFFGTRR